MSTVEVVLPANYTNEWLLTVVNAFDELDVEVKFVTAPSPNRYFYPSYPYPYWSTGSIKPNDNTITINAATSKATTDFLNTINTPYATGGVVKKPIDPVELVEARAQADIDRQIASYKKAFEKAADNVAAFKRHQESAAQNDARDAYGPWHKGEKYGPDYK